VEAEPAAAVLGANYPNTRWYHRAYELMQRHPVPAAAAAATPAPAPAAAPAQTPAT
jgi:hypothetical protein